VYSARVFLIVGVFFTAWRGLLVNEAISQVGGEMIMCGKLDMAEFITIPLGGVEGFGVMITLKVDLSPVPFLSSVFWHT